MAKVGSRPQNKAVEKVAKHSLAKRPAVRKPAEKPGPKTVASVKTPNGQPPGRKVPKAKAPEAKAKVPPSVKKVPAVKAEPDPIKTTGTAKSKHGAAPATSRTKTRTQQKGSPEQMTAQTKIAVQSKLGPPEDVTASDLTPIAPSKPVSDTSSEARAAAAERSGIPQPGPRPVLPQRAIAKAENFKDGDFVVYPTHGVGTVDRIASEEIAGHKLELIHITFDENRMTLRVPVNKARTAGLRKLSSRKQFDEVLATLKGRARIKRTMWSRRAQEYEAKINSGDPMAIAEVVRDLHRNAGQPDQSFSERQIFESALERLAAEYGALEGTSKLDAIDKLLIFLKTE